MQELLRSPVLLSAQQFFAKFKFWSNKPAANDPVVHGGGSKTVEEVMDTPDNKIERLENKVSILQEEVKKVKAKKPYWKIITVVVVVAIIIAAIVGYFMGYGVDLLIDQVKGVFSRV